MATDLATALALGQVGQAGQAARNQRALADRLIGGATAGRPVYSPWAALAQGLTGGIGGYMAADADEQQADATRRAIADALTGQRNQQANQREEVATITQGRPLDEGVQGPVLPAMTGQGRIDALAQLAGSNPAAAAQLGVETAREQRDFQRQIQDENRRTQLQVAGIAAASRQPPRASEFDQLLGAAGIAPNSPQARALALSRLERMGQAPSTNVTVEGAPSVGTIPPGFQLERGENGTLRMAPIPGGPADRTARREDRADGARQDQVQRQGGLVVEEVDRVLSRMDGSWTPVTGIGAGLMSRIPGSAASDVGQLLNTIRAEAAFGRLQQMREASPTGGALGAVTERELALLQASIGSLDQSQGAQQFRDNLNRVRNLYLDIIHGPNGGPERVPLSFGNGQSRSAPSLPGARSGLITGADALARARAELGAGASDEDLVERARQIRARSAGQ